MWSNPAAHDAGIGGVNCPNLVFVQRACREMVVVLLPPLLAVVRPWPHSAAATPTLPCQDPRPWYGHDPLWGTRRRAGSFYYRHSLLSHVHQHKHRVATAFHYVMRREINPWKEKHSMVALLATIFACVFKWTLSKHFFLNLEFIRQTWVFIDLYAA